MKAKGKATVAVLLATGLLVGLSAFSGLRTHAQNAATPPAAAPPATAPQAARGARGGGGGGAAAAKAPVPSSIVDVAKLAAQPTATGTRRAVFDGPTALVDNFGSHITTLNAGAITHAPHQHANEELIVLIEGKLEVSINGKLTVAEKGSILFFASMDLHNMHNIGTEPALYYVFTWSVPPRASGAPVPAETPAPAAK